MFDSQKIDNFFSSDKQKNIRKVKTTKPLRSRIMSFIKLALPSFAALLIGMLIVYPQLKKNINDITADAITPRKGELEKFHMENGAFYITDYKNVVNNFHADTLDETEAGSQIIKMVNPRGTIPTTQKNEVKITSPLGFYNQNNKLLSLKNGVDIQYSAGITTNTEEVFVDFNIGKAYGYKPINTKSETAEINAQGFEYYKDKNLLIYTGKSHITITAENIDGGLR